MKSLGQFFILLVIFLFSEKVYGQWENIGGPEKGQVDEFLYEDGITYAVSRHAIHYSTDDGETWKFIKGSNALPYILRAKVDKGHIYALANSLTQENGQLSYGRLYKLSKIADKWEQLFASYPIKDAFDFAVKSDTVTIVSNDSIYVSIDGGRKVFSKSYRNYNKMNAIPFTITIHKNAIYYNDFDGIYKSTDLINFVKVVNVNFIRYFLPTKDELLVMTMSNEKVIVGDTFYFVNKDLLHELVNDSLRLKTDLTIYPNFTANGKLLVNKNTPYFLSVYCESLLFLDNTTQKWQTKFLNIPDKINEGLYSNKGVRFNWINDNMYYSYRLANFKSNDDGRFFLPMRNGLITDANKLTVYKNTVIGVEYSLTRYDAALSKWIDIAMVEENSFAVCNGKFYIVKNNGLIEIDESGNKVRDVVPANSGINGVYGAKKLLIVKSSFASIRSSIDDGMTWSNFNAVIAYDFNFGVRFINGKYLVWAKQIFAYSDDAVNWTIVKPTFWFKPEYILDVVYDPNSKFYTRDFKSILQFDPSVIEQEPFDFPPFFKNSTDYTISAIDMYANILFLCIVNKGIYYKTNDGFWYAANNDLETFGVNDIAFVGDKIYLGASAYVYRMNIEKLNLQLESGEVFYDKNKNGKKDSGERRAVNIDLQDTYGNLLGNTNKEGIFSFYDPSSSNDSIVVRPSPYYKSTNGPFVLNANDYIQLGIDIFTKYDAVIDLNITTLRPGFSSTLTVVADELIKYDNSPGYFQLYFPKGLKFGKIKPEPVSSSQQYLEWDFNDVFEMKSNTAIVEIFVDESTPIGKNFCFLGKIELFSNEVNFKNNTDSLCATVIGSYDPNDKQVDVGPKIDEAIVNTHGPLEYKIRFQNTGKYKADFIRIFDTLSNNVDVNSFRLISASHAVTYKIKNNVVEFKFINIGLPDSVSNQLLSNGFVKYSVEMKKGLQAGDAIDNTAYIYFDNNAPIKTNKVKVTIDKSNATFEQEPGSFLIYPNPVHDLLFIRSNVSLDDIQKIKIYNSQGQLAMLKDTRSLSLGIDVVALSKGTYNMTLVMKDGTIMGERFVVL